MSQAEASNPAAPGIRTLLVLALPAIVIGIVSALVLWALDEVAALLQHFTWDFLPASLGFSSSSPWWILGVLTLTGLAVGLVVQFAPGHGGHDSATIEFFAPVLGLRALPGVAVVIVLGLAGGVSLGPESPIIAINTALAVWLIARVTTAVPQQLIVLMTGAGTLGAMFGTPVAAALVLTGLVAAAATGGALWDRMFLPLVSAGAGALTMIALHQPALSEPLPKYGAFNPTDLATGALVAVVAAGLAVGASFAFPHLHALFRRMRHPVIYISAGGVLLGVLGIVGGPITLFKGAEQTLELMTDREHFSAGQLVLFTVVKIVALLIAATAGFRGGRIFPSIFIGVAVGELASLLLPSLPIGLAVACGVLGFVMVVGRDGWLAIFLAVAVANDITILPLLCVIVLPAWLVTKLAPEMIVHSDSGPSTGSGTEQSVAEVPAG